MSATAAKPQHVRAAWSGEMIACLLELRLGSLLPRFSSGRAPVQLQEAWNQLQSAFALETGANVSVQQLKNKYHQLKREYEETKRRIDAHNNSSSSSTNQTDELVLPMHWDVVEDAFGKSDGLRGVSFFRRGVKVESAASPDKQLDALSPSTAAVAAAVVAVAPPAAQSAPQSALSTANNTPVRSTEPTPSTASATFRRRSFPASVTPSARPVWSSPAAQAAPASLSSSRKRVLETVDDDDAMEELEAASPPPAKTQKLDLAHAIVAAADTIAKALVASAKIVAASVSSSAELAAQVDEQAKTQARMLALLEQSSLRQDALLQALGQPVRERSSSSTKRTSTQP